MTMNRADMKNFVMPSLHISMTVLNRAGDTVHQHNEVGHSWTRNAWNLQLAAMASICGDADGSFGAGYMSSKDVAGSVYYTAGSSVDTMANAVPSVYAWTPNSATSDFGIVVGTGATAFDIDDYALDAQVAHGSGAGQLSYLAQLAPVQTYTSGTKTWDIVHRRSLMNESGGSIVVAEIGLIWRGALFSSTVAKYILMARDVLGSTVTVANTESLVVEYTISMDLSAID